MSTRGRPAPYDRKRRAQGAIRPVPGTGYSRGRWQLDAHHLMRSAGDRLLKRRRSGCLRQHDEVYRLWKAFNLDQVYDFEQHVRIGERLDAVGKLPPTSCCCRRTAGIRTSGPTWRRCAR
jgi:hypothetical protein